MGLRHLNYEANIIQLGQSSSWTFLQSVQPNQLQIKNKNKERQMPYKYQAKH